MSLIKRYDLKGLNLKQSNINRDPKYASDLLNVHLNNRKELVKRFGFDPVVATVGIDIVEYFKVSKLIQFHSAGLKELNAGVMDAINFSGDAVTITDAPDSDEYNGVLYYTDPSGANFPYKYDGYTTYRAGVPAPNVTTVSGAGAFYYRCALRYRDPKGNITYGDYVQFGPLIDTAVFSFSQMGEGFYEKYGELSGNYTVSVANDTVPVNAGHNYVANDWVMLGDASASENVSILKVLSVTATTVVLDTSGLGAITYDLFVANPVERRTEMIIWKSANETFGYESALIGNPAIDYALNKVVGPVNKTAHTGTSDARFMEDEYDTTILKGLPPKCKYISFNSKIMVLGNNSDNSDVNFQITETDLESSFYWSDLGVGSTVETFPPFNVDKVGVSMEGEISGIFGASDNVIVLKERQIYYVNGNLGLSSYRIRSSLSNEIGCISHRSIIGVLGGCLFMSKRGLYLAKLGSMPVEISDIIEPLFRANSNLDLAKSVTINDSDNERLYIHIPYISTPTLSLVVMFDYLYKEWFLLDGINGVKGISMLVDDLYHADSTELFIRSTTYNDDGVLINGYWRSGYEDKGFPTVTKKWQKVSVITAEAVTWDANITTQNDWGTVDDTDEVLNMIGPMVDEVSLSMAQTKSMRVSIGNATLNQGIHITGYEIEAESTQLRPKGES